MKTDLAEILNEKCSCSTLDKEGFKEEKYTLPVLDSEVKGIEHFYSETPSFINVSDKEKIRKILSSIRNALRLSDVRDRILKNYDAKDKDRDITGGVFLSLDFHQTKEGPKLIEINTNAGGAYLQLKLLEAQIRCCEVVDLSMPNKETLKEVEERFYSIFMEEWSSNSSKVKPDFIAIVDENPKDQFLYPEFLMFRNLFRSKGIQSEILDPRQIDLIGDYLYFGGKKIDMIYNRLTDFHLSESPNSEIRQAWEKGNVIVTPNPFDYDLFAKKTNLSVLSDNAFLTKAGLNKIDSEILRMSIPNTKIVTSENAEELWANRKRIFFKPKEGFGSKAAYYGGKLTKNKFSEIVNGEYVSQEFVSPSVRVTSVSGVKSELKMDIRAYVYKDEILLLASRLYQGQTTNFRTPGGGFSPLYVLPDIL
ncbi:circularly permuted ATPgrasp domain protein [Leptospira hartskeerlii]|uniref:Circularly permuted ATPgrasp domain protein n=1 Tax=Leptospira hartskeerlii TaxID=2023177 RepID=A0A2M9X999_9LEPT|nr:circularly permuted ATPgrasp domain protein [Leptospira hartskeerlii]PJZ24276.1 circularly permuted ATPgrasp domain protein [Leptospira hartskeerlii]PJZ32461.1 circularly permuted ATPgrasp domain protein [Leptospira hartskeerlii]